MGTVRCSADSASMDSVQDSEAGSVRHSVDSASMDPVPDSEAESVRHSADSASTDSVQNQCHLVKLIGSLRGKPLTKIYKL